MGFDKDSRKWKSGRPQSFEVRDSMHSQPSLAELEQFAFPTANHKRLTKSVAAQFERGTSTVLSQHLKPPQISEIVTERCGSPYQTAGWFTSIRAKRTSFPRLMASPATP